MRAQASGRKLLFRKTKLKYNCYIDLYVSYQKYYIRIKWSEIEVSPGFVIVSVFHKIYRSEKIERTDIESVKREGKIKTNTARGAE